MTIGDCCCGPGAGCKCGGSLRWGLRKQWCLSYHCFCLELHWLQLHRWCLDLFLFFSPDVSSLNCSCATFLKILFFLVFLFFLFLSVFFYCVSQVLAELLTLSDNPSKSTFLNKVVFTWSASGSLSVSICQFFFIFWYYSIGCSLLPTWSPCNLLRSGVRALHKVSHIWFL